MRAAKLREEPSMTWHKIWAVRLWIEGEVYSQCWKLVDRVAKDGMKLHCFNNYGDDGHSYRIDLRFADSDHDREALTAYFSKLMEDKQIQEEVLRVTITEWKEPEEVKHGHHVGTLLAVRLREYNKKFPKKAILRGPWELSFLTALILNSWLRPEKIEFPYWMKEYREKDFSLAADFMLRDILNYQRRFTAVERALHNFLQNLVRPSIEGFVWSQVHSWWWLSQMTTRRGGI